MKLTTAKPRSEVVQPQPKPVAQQPPSPKALTSATAAKFRRDEVSTGQGGALRRAAASQLAAATSTTATTLRTERLGDGNANCLERALTLASPNDQIVLLNDSRDASGHALVQHPDGSVTDPNFPQVRYQSLGQWQAANPQYTVAAKASAGATQLAMKLPPGPARDAALAALGLSKAANVAVADETTQWLVVNGRVRSTSDHSDVISDAQGVPARLVGEVEEPLLSELQSTYDAPGAWYEVELESGETGYVWAEKTTTEFDAQLSSDLGAATSPVHSDGEGNLVQTYEDGSVTLRPDGVREVTAADGTTSELEPEWSHVKPDGIVRNEAGNRVYDLDGEPIQLIRQLSETEDDRFGAEGDWYQARLLDGTTIYVRSDNLAELTPDAHLGSLVPPELGAPTTPMIPAEGGGFQQTFEHGTANIDAAGNVTISDESGQTIASREGNTSNTIDAANEFHVTQRTRRRSADTNDDGVPVDSSGNPVGNAYNDGSEWYGFNDCGPTSVVMAVSMVGGMETPTAANAGEAIDSVRDSIFDTNTTSSSTTSATQLAEGVNEAGAQALVHTPASISELDEALASGNPVILGGDPMDAWGSTDPDYLEAGSGGFNHWVVVSGRTPDGNYIVNDPLCPNGARVVTPAELEAYINPGMGMVEVMPK